MAFFLKKDAARISQFRRLQLENWHRQLEDRIQRAEERGDNRLLKALQSERQYLERCW